jgi:hypothetical protein
MAFLVAVIGVSFMPWIARTLDHIGLASYEFSHPIQPDPAGVFLMAGFAHLTGGLIVLRVLARVPGARWWHYAVGGLVGSYLTILFGLALLSFDEAGAPDVCWPCLFVSRDVLLFWPMAICWGLTYWLFADPGVSTRRTTPAK